MAVHIDPLTLAICATAVAGIALAIYGFGQISDAIDDAFFGDCWNCPPDGVKIGGQQTLPGGEAGERPATDNQREIAPHAESPTA